MRRLIFVLTLSLATTALAQTTARPQLAALSPDVRQLVITFLLTDCYAASSVQREQLLAGVSEQVLWEAYRAGPDSGQLAKAQRALGQAYKQRQEFLRRADTNALPKDELARAAQISESEYVQRKVQEFRDRYQANALAGLGVIGTPASVPELTSIASDEKNPASGSAKAALEAIATRYRQQR